MNELEAEQTAIDSIFSNPETINFFTRDTISVKERKITD